MAARRQDPPREGHRVRVLTADLDAERPGLDERFDALIARAHREAPDLVVLPEMPFAGWLAASPEVDPQAWHDAVVAHTRCCARFGELDAEVVVTTQPTYDADGRRVNEALVWTSVAGIVARRHKTFLPDEPGFYEARWYDRGPVSFDPVATPVGMLGVMVCTELWFPEHARTLGEAGVQLLVVPRATPVATADRWEAGARVLATIAGAWCVSVNRGGQTKGVTFGGSSTIVDPEGRVIARSTPDEPVLLAELDLDAATRARRTYPRTVAHDDPDRPASS